MAGTIDELLDMLYAEIEEAKNATFSSDRCVIDRDKVLDMIDDVKAELPVELKRARDLMANKNDYIASAKREADVMRKQAEDYAKHIVSEDALTRSAEDRADEIIAEAEKQAAGLRKVVNEYCEDTLRRVEESVTDALGEVKAIHSNFRALIGQMESDEKRNGQRSQQQADQKRRPAMYDAEADMDEDELEDGEDEE